MRIKIVDCKRPDWGFDEAFKRINKELKPKGMVIDHPAYVGSNEIDAYYCESCGSEVYAYWELASGSSVAIRPILRCNAAGEAYPDTSKEARPYYDEECVRISRKATEYGQYTEKRRYEFLHSDYAKKCPICGAQYYKVEFHGKNVDLPNDFMSMYGKTFEDKVFEYIHDTIDSVRIENAGKQSSDDFSAFTENLESECGLNTLDVFDTFSDTLTVAKLKSYLMSMIQLETDILSSTKYLEELIYQYYLAKDSKCAVNMEPIADMLNTYLEAERTHSEKANAYQEALSRLNQYKYLHRPNMPTGNSLPAAPQKPQTPQYKNWNLFNKKKIKAENELILWMYKKELEKYEEQMAKYNSDVAALKKAAEEEYALKIQTAEKESEGIKQEMDLLKKTADQAKLVFETAREEHLAKIASVPQMSIVEFLGQKVEKTKELIEKLYKTRKEMYALNIVFAKYWDLVSLSTFYEYLSAGRCTTLDGAHGAYNLYEAEIRADRIICQLSDIIESLDDIAKTQRTVYSQLRNMNKTIESLNDSMENACNSLMDIKQSTMNIEKNSKVIAFNTKEAAHYAKVNANLTNALGFMIALK